MIPEIRKILCPTDLSENARYAFEYAASLANRYGAGITILHVLEDLSPNALGIVGDMLGKERWEEIKKRNEEQVIRAIRDRIKGFCEEESDKMPACPFIIDEIIVEIGQPADRIFRQAEKTKCDMIVMGSRGQGMFAEAMLGSTSRKVLRRCKKPVLIVRLPEEDE
ncbi:MAG: universal stress protein [Deltaproteobacteria bacterium]|nr:universal stress protein [Deltaproteobacteria bacterium]MBW2119946.1 universal stress protein [Deltaproteobacteria bacterium]MBW2345089.1 universal stress protein [Deltaproteobacteria bacterium]